ncbi:site-2 protease family protein [Bradyrhizobium sp.]|uniref:site-2 protease family protein n=1 Tax=Bradyrhizobium sp. TaxID=376 RepID=UPI002395AE54|nr:site-2 protease family protein [Bradyrhizobium sp.]MDE1932919.1 site-2 protease family protein [Bradyrhizobium sp.]
MTRHNIPLGRIFGIQIGLDYSWFVIFALLTWMLATSYFPAEFKNWSASLYWLTGAATAIMLFVSVLLHELGHSVIALHYKIPVRSITLFLFGGVAQIEKEPPSPKVEFFVAIGGPLVSLALAVLFYAVQPAVSAAAPLLGLAKYLAYINMALVLFNLIPGYPLDGGRVFRAIIWAVTGSMRRATSIAANVGRFFALLLIFVGIVQMLNGNFGGGIWIAFIGWFLDNAASVQLQQLLLQGMLSGHRVAQAMNTHYAIVPENLRLQELVDERILGTGQRYFLVNRGDSTLGMITLHRVKDVPREKWAVTNVSDVMLPFNELKCTAPETELWSALQNMDKAGVNQMPVVQAGQVVGMLSRDDAITFLRSLQELGMPAGEKAAG